MFTDTAKRKKIKLFEVFADFSKAYNLVPRSKLFTVLKRQGCGIVILGALMTMYQVTQSVVGSGLITVTLQVRQDSHIACLIFVISVSEVVK